MNDMISFGGGGGSDSDSFDSFDSGSDWDYHGSYDGNNRSKNQYSSMANDPEGTIIVVIIFIILLIALMCIFATITIAYFKNKTKRVAAKDSKKQFFSTLLATDNNDTEQEKWIHEEANRIFLQYQKDWSDFNFEGMKSYMTEEYFKKASLMLDAIKAIGRQNIVSDINIRRTSLIQKVEKTNELPEIVKVVFQFSGKDELLDTARQTFLLSNSYYGLMEMWTFWYDGKTLKLADIEQPTESESHLISAMNHFAKENGLFYNPDWGRYTLPERGLIFDRLKYSVADVNNYVIGEWNDCLVQMYTYSMEPSDAQSYYLVGQLNVPKEYKGLVIKLRNVNLPGSKVPNGYEKLLFEWEEFNKKYEVYASSDDALTAFELVNPDFMSVLYDREIKYSLEVAGNVIYFFSNVGQTREESYADMLDVLKMAYSELKR